MNDKIAYKLRNLLYNDSDNILQFLRGKFIGN